MEDRTGVVWGKGVVGQVDIGGDAAIELETNMYDETGV